MKYYFEIIRWKNLLFVVLIQWLIYFSVVTPLLQSFGFEQTGNPVLLWLLTISTVLIAAGGNVINDYFDVKIDRINRPDRVIVGDKISLPGTMRFYQLLTAFGVLVGLITAFLSKSFTLAFIYILTPGLLWFYSASYKRQFLIGNLIVSLSSGLSILIVGILVVSQLKIEYGELLQQTPVPKLIYGWTGGFSAFAFLLTLLREIIKDMEDEFGDRELECRTMPIKWGMKKTKYFLYGLILLIIGGLFFVNFNYIEFDSNFTLRYILFGLFVPLLFLGYLIFKAKNPTDYHQASSLSKFIMLIGLLYSLVFYYLMARKYDISLFGLFLVK